MTYKTTTLDTFVTLQRGYDLPAQDRIPGVIPIIAANGQVGFHNVAKVNAQCVVLGRSGSVGNPQLISEPFWPLNTTLFVKDFHGNSPTFVYYVLKTIDFKSFDAGGTVPTLNRNHLTQIEVPLLDLAHQEAISGVLQNLDAKIAANNALSKTLEDIAQTIFKSWFIDFDPVKAKMAGEKPVGMDDATAALFPNSMEESELGLMPSGWELKAVGDALEVTGGTTPSTSNADYWDGEHCWTTPKDLSNQVGLVTTDSSRKITDAGLAQISSGLLPVYSVLMSCRAPIGYISVNAVPTAVNQGFIALRNSEIYPALFLTNWLESNMQEIKNRAGGATFAEISRKAFKEIGFLVPNQKVLEVYAEITVPILEQLKQMSLQNKNLNELRDSLLPRLISGELQIPDEMLAS